MKRIVLCGLLLAGVLHSARAAKIVYPWCATTAIVKSGETFEVWFDADDGQAVSAVGLRGPYHTVDATYRAQSGSWIYDPWSGNTYDRKITVSVPAGTPADRYDLVLKTSSGTEISLAAVKVIKQYKEHFYVMHISDSHRWQGGYDTPNVILPEVSTVIDIANIIDPEMLFETGDNYYPNGNSESSTRERIVEFMNGTDSINGMNDAHAAYFSVPGNHCTPNKAYQREPDLAAPARYWNEHFGLQTHCFTYGNARFIGINNAWCSPRGGGEPGYTANYQWQLDAAADWVDKVGVGTVRITYQHVPQESIPPLYNALKKAGARPDLMLAGHIHRTNSNPFMVEGRPLVYAANTPRDGNKFAPFNLYRVNSTVGTVDAVGNPSAALSGLEGKQDYATSKLKLTYSEANDGTRAANTATLVNKFNFPILGARIRFVMKPGAKYSVSQGKVIQAFDGDSVHVVDVRLDLEAESTTVVQITSDK